MNVLIGDMSLIGPRPHAERDLLGVEEGVKKIVLLARPGLSGVGSIVFRNEEFILQKFENPRAIYDDLIAPFKAELELWYVQNASIGLYIKLIFATLYALRSKNSDFIYRWLPELPKPPLTSTFNELKCNFRPNLFGRLSYLIFKFMKAPNYNKIL